MTFFKMSIYARSGRLGRIRRDWSFPDRVAKSLSGLEGRHRRGGDGDGLTGLRIASLPGRARSGGERPESGDRDALAPGKGVGDGRDTASMTLSAPALDREASAATLDESSDLFMRCLLGGWGRATRWDRSLP